MRPGIGVLLAQRYSVWIVVLRRIDTLAHSVCFSIIALMVKYFGGSPRDFW
jgi:hypothetical protein